MPPFSIFLSLGTLAGLLLVAWRAPRKETIRYLDAAVFALFLSLLGGRLGFVAVSWGYFASHPVEVFQVWLGGLSATGAILGGVIAIFILRLGWKLPLGLLADTLFPLLGMLCVASWLGCWFNACSYGALSGAWWALPTRDEWGVLAPRFPLQLVGSLLTLVIVWLVDWLTGRLPIPGLASTLGLSALSALLFALTYARADSAPIWQGLRLDAWGALGLMLLSGLLVVVLLVRWRVEKQSASNRRVL